VDLVFSTSRLQQLCTCLAKLRGQLGDDGARTAAAHLASLRAASCLEEFRHLPGRCTEHDGRLALVLAAGRRLIFEPADDPSPTDSDGALDWAAVRSIRIVEITSR
jgi:toxin HigB-1